MPAEDINPTDPQATPEPAAATAVPQTPSAPAPVSPAQGGLLESIKEFGFENVTNEQEAQSRILADYKRLREEHESVRQQYEAQQPLIKYGQEYLESLRQRPAEQPAPAAEQADHPWWKAPKFDPNLADRYRTQGPDGEPQWKPETPASIRAAADDYQAYIQQWTYDLATRPHEVLPQIIEAEVKKHIESFYEQRTTQQTEEQFLTEFREKNAWIYETDPRTQKPVKDLFTGQPRYSEEGQKLLSYVSEAQELGIESIRGQLQYAQRLYDLQKPVAAPSAPAAAQPNAALKRQTAARAASRAIPQRNGSEADPTERPRPQNRNRTFGEDVIETMRNEGALASP